MSACMQGASRELLPKKASAFFHRQPTTIPPFRSLLLAVPPVLSSRSSPPLAQLSPLTRASSSARPWSRPPRCSAGNGTSPVQLDAEMQAPAVQVANDRRFVNVFPDPCAEETGGRRHCGADVEEASTSADAAFLEAGLAWARQAVEGLQRSALQREGPFLYTGLLGSALVCLRCAQARARAGAGPVGSLGGQDEYLRRAAEIVRECERAAARGKEYVSFYIGQPGIHAVGAAVSAALGDRAAAGEHMQKLLETAHKPELSLSPDQLWALEGGRAEDVDELAVSPGGIPHEVLYGRAGFIWAVLFANDACRGQGMGDLCVPVRVLDPIAASVIQGGRALARDDVAWNRSSIGGIASTSATAGGAYPPLMYEWHFKRYWGAAHGLLGILHVLLLAHKAGVRLAPDASLNQSSSSTAEAEQECVEDMKATLRYMVAHRFPSGNYPTSEEGREKDCRVHWCHGAPGAALTLALYAQAFPEERDFLEAAEAASDVVWHRGLLRRPGLCHGISGNAYAFLALSRTPGSRLGHVDRARDFGRFLLSQQERLLSQGLIHPGDSPFSIMEGIGGSACLLLDLVDPARGRFPGYEL